jgi:hypothetical protein
MLVTEPGDYAGLANVDRQRGFLRVNVVLLGARAQCAQQTRCRQEHASLHGSFHHRKFDFSSNANQETTALSVG